MLLVATSPAWFAVGFAIGGVSVGEGHDLLCKITALTAPLLPDSKPRYLMGVGLPEDLLAAIGLAFAWESVQAALVCLAAALPLVWLLFRCQRRQTEIKNFYFPLGRSYQVVRFDVTMDHAVFVGMLKSSCRLADVVAGERDTQWPSASIRSATF